MSCTISGTFINPDGSPVALGTLILTLSQNAVDTGTGWVVLQRVTVALNSSGAIPAGTTIIGNDVLVPTGTTYYAEVKTAGDAYYPIGKFAISGSTFNFNTATPTGGGVSYPFPVLQQPTSLQTITGQALDFISAPVNLDKASPLTGAVINGVAYVGGGIVWTGGDIGADINAAYAALPATGGLIYVAPNTNNTPYSFSTPIVFGTIAKPASLKGLGPAGFNPNTNTFSGCILNYTPTAGKTSDAVTQVLPSLSVTALSVSGSVVTLTGTFTGCGSNLLAGITLVGRNFTNSGNNTAFTVSTSSTTTITGVYNGTQVNEASPPGNANIYNRARAVYVGTFTGTGPGNQGASNGYAGRMVNITGFTSAAGASGICNTGYFGVEASSATGLLVFNAYAVAETRSANAATCQPAITLNYSSNTTGDGFVPNYIEDIVLQNVSSSITNFGNGYSTIGIDYSGAGGVTFNRVAIQGFGVGEVFNAGGEGNPSNTWGAVRQQFTLSHNNVGQVFINGMENYNWFGGKNIVNGIGVYDAGGDIPGDIHWHGVSFDSNVFSIRDMWGGSDFVFMACHFENNGTTLTSASYYAYVESANVTVIGGRILDDQPTGTPPAAWFNVGPTTAFAALTVIGVDYFALRFPTTAAFVGTSAVFVQGVNGNAGMTNLVSGPSSGTINFSQANQGNQPTAQIGPILVVGADPGQAPVPSAFAAQLRVGGQVAAQQGFASTGAGVTLSAGSHNIGLATNCSLFHLRDSSNGSSCLVLVDNITATPVIVSSIGTSNHFTAGSPTNQIGLTYSSSLLVATANGTAVGAILLFTQFMTQ